MLQYEHGLLSSSEYGAGSEAWQEASDRDDRGSAAQGSLAFLYAAGVFRNEPTSRSASPRRPFLAGRWRPRVLLAAAAAVALAVILSIPLWRLLTDQGNRTPSPHRGPTIARLTHVAGAHFAYGVDGHSSPVLGSAMPSGYYQLQSGIAQLDFESGARVVVENAARFQLVSADKMILFGGRLSAHVPPSAIGFTVETRKADVVDFGTDFGVNVQPGQHAEVHVFEGEVEMRPRRSVAGLSVPLRLFTGEASRIDERTGVPAGINLATLRFVRALDEPISASSRRILALNPAVYYQMEPTDDGLTLYDASGDEAHGRVDVGFALEGVWAAGQSGTALRLGGAGVPTRCRRAQLSPN